MSKEIMTVQDLLDQFETMKNVLSRLIDEQGLKPNTRLDIFSEQKRILDTVEQVLEETKETSLKVEDYAKVTGRHVKNIKSFITQRVNEMMNTYYKEARNTLWGNIQGYVFKYYAVNAFEDIPLVVYKQVCDDISKWIPDEKVEGKLAKWKIPYEQLELLEGEE